MVRGEEDPHPGGTSRMKNLDHMRHAAIRFHHLAYSGPQLSAVGDEVVVRIDNQESRPVQSKRHGHSPQLVGRCHWTTVMSGLPFSTMYVASSAARPVPTFLAEWTVPGGMNRTSPALRVTGGLPSTVYSHVPSRT